MSRILLVDDDNLVLATLSRALAGAGFETLVADDPWAGLQRARDVRPDLAVLDIRMPGLSGIELGKRLIQELGVPFMLFSAFSDDLIVDAGIAAGALGYLVKPVSPGQVVPAIRAALARGHELQRYASMAGRMDLALHDSREISTAVGILMERHRMTAEQAFERLRSCARSQRRKVLEAASRVILDSGVAQDPDRAARTAGVGDGDPVAAGGAGRRCVS